jgi:hypothetical protein
MALRERHEAVRKPHIATALSSVAQRAGVIPYWRQPAVTAD